jgi:hypothetical protein
VKVFLRIALLFAIAVVFPSCSVLKKLRKKEPAAPRAERVRPEAPQRMGKIVLVNAEDRFVLIDAAEGGIPNSGTALKVFRDSTEVAVLTMGSVQRRPFFVADIASGEPAAGDVVFR